MARIAFVTVALLRAPSGDPAVRGFEIRIGPTFERAADAAGFLGSYAELPRPGVDPTLPTRWRGPEHAGRIAITLTLWTDLESVYAFAYGDRHSGLIRRGHAWMLDGDWPRHVAWWVDDDVEPTPADASDRYDRLGESGPTPDAFTFDTPFAADGSPTALDLDRVALLQSR